jgi:hypothetical protein
VSGCDVASVRRVLSVAARPAGVAFISHGAPPALFAGAASI